MQALLVLQRQFPGEVPPSAAVGAAIARTLGSGEAAGAGSASEFAIGVSGTLLYLGADVMDNVLDDEIPDEWARFEAGALTLCGAALVAMAPLPIVRSDGWIGRSASAAAGRIVRGSAVMAAGEIADLRSDACSPRDALREVDAKAGEQFAALAGAAAMLTCPDCVDAAEEFGRAVGTAGQLGSDVHDVWHRRPSRDLLNGRRTLPVVVALNSDPRGVAPWLAAAQSDPGSHDSVATVLAAQGALVYARIRIRESVHRATRALARMADHGHDTEPLSALLDTLLDQRVEGVR